MAPRLATVEELAGQLDVEGEDALLERLLESAEIVAERYARRRFSPDPADPADPPIIKTYNLRPGQRQVRIPDLRQLDVVVAGGYQLNPWDFRLSYGAEGTPATHLYLRDSPYLWSWNYWGDVNLEVSGWWGFDPVPEDVRHAVLSAAARAYRVRDAAYGDSVMIEGGGSLNYVRQMSEEAQAILDTYRVPNMAIV